MRQGTQDLKGSRSMAMCQLWNERKSEDAYCFLKEIQQHCLKMSNKEDLVYSLV